MVRQTGMHQVWSELDWEANKAAHGRSQPLVTIRVLLLSHANSGQGMLPPLALNPSTRSMQRQGRRHTRSPSLNTTTSVPASSMEVSMMVGPTPPLPAV